MTFKKYLNGVLINIDKQEYYISPVQKGDVGKIKIMKSTGGIEIFPKVTNVINIK